jgi:DNA-binding SARP family transcriptional activator
MNNNPLELQLLGQPTVITNGYHITLRTRKSLGLIAHLALEGSSNRSELAELFWGDMTDEDARMNLRRELGRIKQSGFEQITTQGSNLGLPETLECDVIRFQQAVQNEHWSAALNLYRGVFLDGLKSEGQSQFDDWLERTRARLQDQYLEVLQGRATELEHEHKLSEALGLHQKGLELDDLSEHRYRSVIRLQGLLGQREAAIKNFQRLTSMLEREFGLQPLPESVQLIDRIRVVTSVQVASSPAPNPIQTMPLVGREQVWVQLESIWSRGKFIFVSGGPGMGKTRLINEFMSSKGPHNLLTGHPHDRIQPYSTIVRGMRQILARRPNLELEPWLRHELSRLMPELGNGKTLEPIRSEDEQHRLFEAVGELCYGIEYGDVALTSDDFHFSDDASLKSIHSGALKYLKADEPSRHLTAFRRPELTGYSKIMIDGLLEMNLAEEIELKPLTELQTLDLVRQLSGSTAERFSKRLYDVAGGNPFYSLEVLRHLFDIGMLEVRDGQWHTAFDADTADYRELTIPETLKTTVLERVDRTGAGARRLLEAASLIGMDFRASDLEGATALSDWEQLEVLERAEQSQFIAQVQTTSGQHGFTFSHDLVRRSLRDGINPERKTLLHRKLGATAIHNAQAPEVIAEHLEQAGRFHEAAPYRLQAAEKLSRVFDHAEALEQYEKMLTYLPQDSSETYLELLCGVAEVCWKLNEIERAEHCFLEAQRLMGSVHAARLKARIWIGICQVANQKSDLERTQESGRQALHYAQESQDETILAAASRWLEPAETPQL